MADLEFDKQDIEDLAQKLSTLGPVFNNEERQLLLAIFAAAADAANAATPDSPATLPMAESPVPAPATGDYNATLENLKQQLLRAYSPGNSFASVTKDGPHRGRITKPPPGT